MASTARDPSKVSQSRAFISLMECVTVEPMAFHCHRQSTFMSAPTKTQFLLSTSNAEMAPKEASNMQHSQTKPANHTAHTSDALLTVKDVSAAVRLARSTIHNMVKDGTFPAPIRLSKRCVRWHSKAIQQWIESLATSAQ